MQIRADIAKGIAQDIIHRCRIIVLLTQEQRGHPLKITVLELTNEGGGLLIVQVAIVAGNPQLHRLRIGAPGQLLQIMISLYRQRVTITQGGGDMGRNVPCIRKYA